MMDNGQYKRTAFKEAANQVLNQVKSILPECWELDNFLITGL